MKQGFYRFRAPIGYLDQGSAKAKIPDPIRAPLIQEAFKLYSSGRFSLPNLAQEMFRRGLRNHNGGPVTINGLATILKNSFYVGIIRINKTGQTFDGDHEPLITTSMFERVQAVLAGKRVDRSKNHVFRYSRIARRGTCGYSLIAERQKGHAFRLQLDQIQNRLAKLTDLVVDGTVGPGESRTPDRRNWLNVLPPISRDQSCMSR